MSDAKIHFQGRDAEWRSFPTLPRGGELLDTGDGLWRITYAVYGAVGVELYAVKVSAGAAAELRAAWQTWGDVVAVVEGDALPGQRPLFS